MPMTLNTLTIVYRHELPDHRLHVSRHQLGRVVENRFIVIVSLEFNWCFLLSLRSRQRTFVLCIWTYKRLLRNMISNNVQLTHLGLCILGPFVHNTLSLPPWANI